MNRKIIIFVACLLICFSAVAQNNQLTREDYDQALNAWYDEFSLYLLQQKDSELRSYGVFFLSFDYIESNSDDQLSIESAVNELFNAAEISYEALFLLWDACNELKKQMNCSQETINDQLIQKHSDNLISFIPALNLAIEQKDISTAIDLIQQMSRSKYASDLRFYSNSFEKAYSEYVKLNSYSQELIDYEISLLERKSKISDELINMLSQNMSYYLILVDKIFFNMALPGQDLQKLITFCIERPDLLKECQSISQILISKGKDTSITHTGHVLNVSLTELLNDPKKLELAKSQKDAYRSKIDCLFGGPAYPPHLFNMNAEFWKQRHQVSRDVGEVEGLIHYSKLRKTNYKKCLE